MSAPGLIIGVRCHYCSKFFPEGEVIRFGESMVRCNKCTENHLKALDALATGGCPDACMVCEESCASIEARLGKATLYLCSKDGLYQFLCVNCMMKYASQRQDLFRDTRYGYEQKIV